MRIKIRTVECNSRRFQHFPVLFLTVEKITDFSKKEKMKSHPAHGPAAGYFDILQLTLYGPR